MSSDNAVVNFGQLVAELEKHFVPDAADEGASLVISVENGFDMPFETNYAVVKKFTQNES